jgi:hypothetical protein
MTFGRELKAAAETVQPSCAIDIDLREIAEDADRRAASFSGDGPAGVKTPEQLFQIAERAQDVRTGMDRPDEPVGAKVQIAIDNLKNFIITHRVFQVGNGGAYEWTE